MTSGPEVESSVRLSLLALSELFGDLEPSSLGELSPEIEVLRLAGGETLMKEGDPADCMYTVVSGRLHVSAQGEDGESRFLGEIRAGESAGELDLIDGQARMATVRAARDSELVRVSRLGFEKLIRHYPELMHKVARVLVRRMRSLAQRQYPPTIVQTIAIIGAGRDPGVGEFSADLCSALRAFGPVLHLSQDRFEKLYGGGFDPDSRMTTWLSELEGVYRFVVWEAGDRTSPWTMHCMRQADRIVAVGRAWSSPELGEVEKSVIEERKSKSIAPVELVLLHEETGRIFAGTAVWLENRDVFRHHHVRLHVPGDLERVARILSGRAIGLTLGGGGARGFAHIGVIRAIEEAGIPIDMICGVSMGAIIAGQYAMGCDWQTMIRITKSEMADRRMGNDFTLPVMALSSGRKLRRALKTFFAKTAIEDLWLNYFCVSCSLSTSETIVHQSGLLWKCVNASNALPGILPPVLEAGHVLVDGGILNNQPGDILKAICSGSVIVSSVSPRREVTVDSSYTEMPSPWRVLRSRLNRFEETIVVPGISATMMRTLMVASHKKSREVERMADFYLRPPTDRFRLDDFSKLEEIVDVGYQYAREEIGTWKATNRI